MKNRGFRMLLLVLTLLTVFTGTALAWRPVMTGTEWVDRKLREYTRYYPVGECVGGKQPVAEWYYLEVEQQLVEYWKDLDSGQTWTNPTNQYRTILVDDYYVGTKIMDCLN